MDKLISPTFYHAFNNAFTKLCLDVTILSELKPDLNTSQAIDAINLSSKKIVKNNSDYISKRIKELLEEKDKIEKVNLTEEKKPEEIKCIRKSGCKCPDCNFLMQDLRRENMCIKNNIFGLYTQGFSHNKL